MSGFLSTFYILVAGKIGIPLLWQFEGFQNCKIWSFCQHCAWCSRYSITLKIMLAIRCSSAGHRLTTLERPTQDTRKIWISWKGNFHYKNSALKFFPLQEFLGKQNNLPSYIQVKIRNFLSRNSRWHSRNFRVSRLNWSHLSNETIFRKTFPRNLRSRLMTQRWVCDERVATQPGIETYLVVSVFFTDTGRDQNLQWDLWVPV